MKILVIDGQGGGLGKALVTGLLKEAPEAPLIALGTNALATAAMLKAGAKSGATGEHAITWQCRDADLILGAMGILVTGGLMGEISPIIAAAISQSPATKILVPSQRCGVLVAGTRDLSLEEALTQVVQLALEKLREA